MQISSGGLAEIPGRIVDRRFGDEGRNRVEIPSGRKGAADGPTSGECLRMGADPRHLVVNRGIVDLREGDDGLDEFSGAVVGHLTGMKYEG